MLILAATYAFAKRVDLQDVCDDAALAAANSVDLARARDRGVSTAGTSQRPSSL
jgi:Flp pilus assembly protein TadG